MTGPVITFYPYQKRWLADRARFKIGMFARQTGKTFTSCAELVDDCIAAETERRRARWVILSRGERQAKEAMDEGVKPLIRAFFAIYDIVAGEPQVVETEWKAESGVSYKALEVAFEGGSRITALPANPDTARGFSANVLLDEFAFHKDSRSIWKALFPVISKPGLKLRVVSTPNGKSNKFYELMTGHDDGWSRHVCDIHQAVAEGCPRDIDELRQALADPDAWAQEYELQWLDEASAWLSYDLIARCESEDAADPSKAGNGRFYLGMDIARRRHLTVMWVIEQVGDVGWTREVVKMRNATFADQEAELDRLMRAYAIERGCLDQTGVGEQMVERAKERHGESRIEGVLFHAVTKQDMAIRLKKSFEDRRLRISPDRDTRDSLHAVKKFVTAGGSERFDADATEKGHADEFWALALANLARDAGAAAYEYQPVVNVRGGDARDRWERPDHSGDDARPWHRPPLGARLRGGL
jgi:phage FluMu gp28-like protein